MGPGGAALELAHPGLNTQHTMSISWPVLRVGLLAGLCTSLLIACGGGSSSASSVSGVAATGAAIINGTVTLKCVAGSPTTSATTGTDGSFTIDVTGATLPCMARVSYTDSSGATQTLHSFITTAGTANITPVTELLTATVLGGSAATAFDSFDATKVKAVTTQNITDARSTVKTYLRDTLGVDVTNLPDDPVGTRFSAKTTGSDGDSADKVLDDLKTRLAAKGKKLSDASGEITKTGSGSGSGGGTAKPGDAVGKGAYSAVKAEDNATFLNTVASQCTKDPTLSDKDHDVWIKCKEVKTGAAKDNLVYAMWLGALPNTGTTVISGPGAATTGTVSSVSGLTDVAASDSCRTRILEPFIPIIAIQVKGSAYTGQLALGTFSFNGTDDDKIYVTPGGVVLQYVMTDGKGNKLMVSINTDKGTANSTVGSFSLSGSDSSDKWFACQ